MDKISSKIHAEVKALMAGEPDRKALHGALRTLARWRSYEIGAAILRGMGPEIRHGPFKGMSYDVAATEGSFSARLLGSYEATLHPIIEEIVERAYPVVIDVGCAEGYYTVGLARRMPETRVIAYDIDPAARANCAKLASQNGVADRIEIREKFDPDMVADFAAEPYLLFCDAEGAEEEFLDPSAPGMD